MKISAHYSHMNGYEWLQLHRPGLWDEVCKAVAAVDAAKCKTKVSEEQRMLGKLLYSPTELNKEFEIQFVQVFAWMTAVRTDFFCTDDPGLTRQMVRDQMPLAQQKAFLKANGKEAVKSHFEEDFLKDGVYVEVQLGKYFAVTYDLYAKHLVRYKNYELDVAIEIVPMKVMQQEMSSGPTFYEKNLHELIRRGRNEPPCPLVLVGVEP
jgi:hypothetical protein